MPEQERLLISIPAACAALGDISRPTLYEMVNAGELVKVNVGRRSFIVAKSLEQYVNRLSRAATDQLSEAATDQLSEAATDQLSEAATA